MITKPVGWTSLTDEEKELLPDSVVTDYVKGYISLDQVRDIRSAERRNTVERIRAALAEVDPDKKGSAIPRILDEVAS